MKVVLDANVYISAIINNRGNPKKIIERWQAGDFDLLVTHDTMAELERVLNYPKIAQLHQWTKSEIAEFLRLLYEESIVVTPGSKLDVVEDDESDNRYLECALAGHADYLVTGDKKHLLPIREYEGVKIVAPALFLAILALDN